MSSESTPPPELPHPGASQSLPSEPRHARVAKRRRLRTKVAFAVAALMLTYLLVAYLALPYGWIRYARRHPSLDDIPRITYTGSKIPGDPLNVALIGTERELKTIMLAAEWYPADPLTLRSCLEIAEASVLKRQYGEAPVSNLYYEGRKQDLAFQQPVDNNPRKRHHVRFWQVNKIDEDGRPVWVGAAVYDEKVGLSRRTGQITHVTAADVDAERDYLFRDLERTGELADLYVLDNFHKEREGRNGGGDPWRTDGNLYFGVIAAKGADR
jgi:LssY C-terminus